jgi:hypothetical protein
MFKSKFKNDPTVFKYKIKSEQIIKKFAHSFLFNLKDFASIR